jgi:hypothetical protein
MIRLLLSVAWMQGGPWVTSSASFAVGGARRVIGGHFFRRRIAVGGPGINWRAKKAEGKEKEEEDNRSLHDGALLVACLL